MFVLLFWAHWRGEKAAMVSVGSFVAAAVVTTWHSSPPARALSIMRTTADARSKELPEVAGKLFLVFESLYKMAATTSPARLTQCGRLSRKSRRRTPGPRRAFISKTAKIQGFARVKSLILRHLRALRSL
jgi:hypothetical protein